MQLIDKPNDIQKVVDGLLIKELNGVLSKAADSARSPITELVAETIKGSNEVQTLNSSIVRGNLGLKSSQVKRAIDAVSEAVSSTTQIITKQLKKSGTKIHGGLTVNIQPSDLKNVLSLGEGQITYRSSTYKTSVNLDWLKWLLQKGDSIIVGKFDFSIQPGTGRSGEGTMKKNVGGWRVPPSISGTIEDNFVTRAFDMTIQTRMMAIIEKSMKEFWG